MTTREFLFSSWGWHPVVIGFCVAAILAYAKAVGFQSAKQAASFLGGVLIFFLTVASPISVLANGYLFSAHMLQHLLLLLVVPVLVLIGLPESKSNGGIRLHPFAAWAAGLSAMWIWHERTLCNAATTTATGRVIQIVSLLALGVMFWSPIIGPRTGRRLPPLLGVIYLFSACVGCTILGILITFAPAGVVCPVFMHTADHLGILQMIRSNWGISAVADQKIGGLMMWVPACGIYVSGVIGLLIRWYRTNETSAAVPEMGRTYSAPRATGENI